MHNIYCFFSETKNKHFKQKIETNIIYKCVCIIFQTINTFTNFQQTFKNVFF